MTSLFRRRLRKYLVRPVQQSRFGVAVRRRIFRFLEWARGYPELHAFFEARIGYKLNLENPSTFNEKVQWKKLYDRNPLLPVTADKYRVRGYIRSRLGAGRAEQVLIPLLHVTRRPKTIPFDSLPDEYIIKANHGSGTNIIVTPERQIDRRDVIASCRGWLRLPYGYEKHEWAYEKIRRRIIIEPLLKDEAGEIPLDYKVHMIHGSCAYISVDVDRFSSHTRTLYTPRWEKLPVRHRVPMGPDIPKSPALHTMLELSERLSEPFDFVRVDFYLVNDRVYFGELTHYPGSGARPYDPTSFDEDLGAMWTVQRHYWKGNE